MFWFLFALSSVLADIKEVSCFLLATKSTTYRSEEVAAFLEANPTIDKTQLKKKIQEDVFADCFKKITKEEAEKIKTSKINTSEGFDHLINIELSKYVDLNDFTVSPKFREIQKRVVSEMTMHGKNDPRPNPGKQDHKKILEGLRKKKSEL